MGGVSVLVVKKKGNKILLDRTKFDYMDISELFLKIRECMKIFCIGISDKVYSAGGKCIGRVGFHDYDGKMLDKKLRDKIEFVCGRLKTHMLVMETTRGYHFISFDIMEPKEYMKWKKAMKISFPSDYMATRNGHRTLRISSKGSSPPPVFKIFSNGIKSCIGNRQSSGHVVEYQKLCNEISLRDHLNNIVNTRSMVTMYSTIPKVIE
jgi:hypothetical protein